MKNTFKADPLEYFPYEISEHILSYLPVKDLMRASMVNSLWYDFIGQSSNLMKNVKLKISCNMDRDYSTLITNSIMASTRKYEALEIERCAECMDGIFDLLKVRPWSHILITNTCFTTREQTRFFFSLIQKNVKCLEISGVYVRFPYSDGKNNGFQFPNLKKFVARNTQAFLFPEIFNISTLTQFELLSNEHSVASMKAVMNLFKQNVNLEELKISGRVFHQILYEDISNKFPFKLKKLSISNATYQVGDFYKRFYTNLIALLNQQSESLESIILDDWLGEDVFKSIYMLPKLKSLTIKGFTQLYLNEGYKDLILAKNPSVKKLSIDVVPENSNVIKAVVAASPNLKSLSISFMNLEIMDIISQNSASLKNLSVEYLNIPYLPKRDLFKNLEYLDVKDYRQCLRKSIMRKKFNNLTDFEQLLFFIMID